LLYKKLEHCIAVPLSLLFTSFMSVGSVPQAWTHAIVIPVYKGGPSSYPSNYRPISLTCVASKIMERVVVLQMLSHLHSHKLITSQQHGFLSKRSTSTNLLETLQDWTLAIRDKKSVFAVYINFAKAFDTVSHNKLFLSLCYY